MPLPELIKRQALRQLEAFCAQQAQHQSRPRRLAFQLAGNQVNLFEERSCLHGNHSCLQIPVAQLRYSGELNQWTLHHQNGRHWQLYLNITPSLDIGKLLSAIRQDPMGCFWSD